MSPTSCQTAPPRVRKGANCTELPHRRQQEIAGELILPITPAPLLSIKTLYPRHFVCCARISGSMKMSLHIFALFLFVTTQCFAPLVHAHVDGMQGDASFHAHDIRQHLSSPELSQCHVESYESQAISIPHEHPRDDTFVMLYISSPSAHPLPPSITKAAVEPHAPLRPPTSAFRKPHTQAPPA